MDETHCHGSFSTPCGNVRNSWNVLWWCLVSESVQTRFFLSIFMFVQMFIILFSEETTGKRGSEWRGLKNASERDEARYEDDLSRLTSH